MNYSIKQLPDTSWGIYSEFKLIAKIRCYYTGLKILELLRKKAREERQTTQEFSLALCIKN